MLNSLKKIILGSVFAAFALSGCGTENSLQMPLVSELNSQDIIQDVTAENVKYKLIEIVGIGPVYEKKLNDIGIKYTSELLKAAAKEYDRQKLAEKTGISHKLILTWVNHIDLMRLKGIGPKQSNWLEAVGVDSIPELAQRNAQNLHERLEIANNIDPKKKFVDRMVSVATVQSWIDAAKKTEPSVIVSHQVPAT